MKAMSEQFVAACMANNSCNAVLILGVTRSGRAFRPGDWTDRLAGLFSTFGKDRLLKYSPCVRPVIADGARSLLVDGGLLEGDPRAFRFVLDFAKDNDLLIRCIPGREEMS